MRQRVRHAAGMAVALAALLGASALAESPAGSGSLRTAEFPDVVEFDFEQVNAHYERANQNVGKVTPILDKALERGEEALKAGEAALKNPTEENRRRFVAAVLRFVSGAEESKARIAELQEDVRTVHAQTGILYAQATTQTAARIEELRREFRREEIKYKELQARNKAKRREGELNDWELRNLFEQERRQAQVLNRIADRVAFQQDFLQALEKAQDRSTGDFTLYEQFFAEASSVLTDISDLASNLPIVVERLQIASAMAGNIPSRQAALAGFKKIERTREITKTLASQLTQLCAGDLSFGNEEGDRTSIVRHTEIYRRWLDGEPLEYRRPARSSE